MNTEQLFISDLHLDPARPEAIALFLDFLQNRAAKAAALYILGDLFEYWVGDDDDRIGLAPVLAALRTLTDRGVPVFFMAGNRDFLIGTRFAQITGCTLLGDTHLVQLDGQMAVLMHGDTLCTDDRPYQQLRGMLRNPQWQHQFLSQPLAERRAQAESLRAESQNATREKAEAIMDVNPEAVTACFHEHGVTLLIHGHTHRPGQHTLSVDGQTCTRLVLGDWYTQGSVLSASADTLSLEALPL
ncbi:UDP-2,3-diacylglucosamine diphosphatase [Acidihalobacter yilgarnensis]|uniref:UDP-2,3-diacylglucosamine hydrolase n=1 Tax=Acidihalobacter yilgarnensis TaxID=2819280 RepID=A0A1D8IM50_9GAMM|nr:UDP-2,3-diacylglucosamine diphosphatase [Acidihalobacter yilgarnensis]AOU97501.1 UDP-2,3-diacylglucosamine diphosphatase [Acidihalobacter yilgarnensis]